MFLFEFPYTFNRLKYILQGRGDNSWQYIGCPIITTSLIHILQPLLIQRLRKIPLPTTINLYINQPTTNIPTFQINNPNILPITSPNLLLTSTIHYKSDHTFLDNYHLPLQNVLAGVDNAIGDDCQHSI